MARTRSPGGGRKPAGEFSDLTETLSVRMPADMKAQIAASAARRRRGKGWTLTQEILRRVYDAFRQEREDRRDPPARALCHLLTETIRTVGHNVSPEWRSDPFAYRTVRLAFDRVLDKLAPPGAIRPPARRSGEGSGVGSWPLPGSGSFFLWDEGAGEITPEEAARMTSDLVLMALGRPSRNDDDPSFRPTSREQEDFEYGMSDARRGLQIEKGK